MKYFQANTPLDKFFLAGLAFKSIDGLIEVVGGGFLLFLTPDHITRIAKLFTSDELNQGTHDFIANHLLHWAGQLTRATLLFGAIYLLAHGLSKLVLVFEILRNHLWAYIGLIVLTGGFVIYQSYEIVFSHSITLSLLTIFDIIIIYLTVIEYKKQKLSRETKRPTG